MQKIPKKIVLLGSTGSVGTSAVKVAKSLPEEVQIIGLAGGSRVAELAEQAIQLGVKQVCIYDHSRYADLKSLLPPDIQVTSGDEGLCALASMADADMIIVAIVGTAGLGPTLAAINAHKELAIASKEILVMAGELVMKRAKENNVLILPIDSEHNAIFQCLADRRPNNEIRKLILTASGGPFRKKPASEFKQVSVSDALAHPTWSMGQKISIDSATLFNKGLEMIEAKWLFDMPMEKIDIIVHPQSIIHSMVEYIDGSIIAQMNSADMRFPIQYAITWPHRIDGGLKSIDFTAISQLEFETPRFKDFPSLNIAIEAGKAGGTTPAVMNAANEVAVDAFLKGKIKFTTIWHTVEQTIERCELTEYDNLEALIAADNEAKQIAREITDR